MGVGDFFGRKKTFTTITVLTTTLFLVPCVMGENTVELIQDCGDRTILELSQICKVSEGNMWESADIDVNPGQPQWESADIDVNPGQPQWESADIDVNPGQPQWESADIDVNPGQPQWESADIDVNPGQQQSSQSTEAVTGQSQETIDPIQDTWEYSKGNPEFGQEYEIVKGDTLSGIAKSLLKEIYGGNLSDFYTDGTLQFFKNETSQNYVFKQIKIITVMLHEGNSGVIGDDADYIKIGDKLDIPSREELVKALTDRSDAVNKFGEISGLEDNKKWFNTSNDFTYEKKVDEMISDLESWKDRLNFQVPEDMTLLKEHEIEKFLATLGTEHIEFLNVLEGETGFLDPSEINLVKEKIAELKRVPNSQSSQAPIPAQPAPSSSAPESQAESSVQSTPDQSTSTQPAPSSSAPEVPVQSPGGITFETPQTFEQLKSLITTKIPEGTSNLRYTSILNTLNRIGSLEDELPTLNENASFSEKLEYFEQNLKILGTKKNLIDRNLTTLEHLLINTSSALDTVNSDIEEVEQEIREIIEDDFLFILHTSNKEFLTKLVSPSFNSYLTEDQIEQINERLKEIFQGDEIDILFEKSQIDLSPIIGDLVSIHFVNSFAEDLGDSGKIGDVPILDIYNLQQDFDKIMKMYSNDSILNSTSPIFTEEQANAYLNALDDLYSNISNLRGNRVISVDEKKLLLEYIEHKFLFVVHQNDIVEDIRDQFDIIRGLGDEVKYGDSGDSGKFKKAVDELHNLRIINEEVLDEIDGTLGVGQENVASVKDYLNRSEFSGKFLGEEIEVDESKISHKFEVPESNDSSESNISNQ